MSFFGGGKSHSTSELPRAHSSSHSRSSTRKVSPTRSTASGRSGWTRPAASSHGGGAGIFGGGSARGIFGSSTGGSSSYYKRRPRDGYVQYLLHKLQRMIKELWTYARRNPVKAFFAVVVPLLSAGGAVAGLLKQFGVRLPFASMLGGGAARRGGGGYYGSSGYGDHGLGSGGLGGLASGLGGGGGWMQNAGSLMTVAKMFM